MVKTKPPCSPEGNKSKNSTEKHKGQAPKTKRYQGNNNWTNTQGPELESKTNLKVWCSNLGAYLWSWYEIPRQVFQENEGSGTVYWGNIKWQLSNIHNDQYTGNIPWHRDAYNHPWHVLRASQYGRINEIPKKEEYWWGYPSENKEEGFLWNWHAQDLQYDCGLDKQAITVESSTRRPITGGQVRLIPHWVTDDPKQALNLKLI